MGKISWRPRAKRLREDESSSSQEDKTWPAQFAKRPRKGDQLTGESPGESETKGSDSSDNASLKHASDASDNSASSTPVRRRQLSEEPGPVSSSPHQFFSMPRPTQEQREKQRQEAIARRETGFPLPFGGQTGITPVEKLDPTSLPSFVSIEPKIGDPPSCDWSAFRKPKLRRYSMPSSFEWQSLLGRGVDGTAFRARADGRELVVKVFHHSRWMENLAYWAFARECRNCAVLELITTSIRHAKDQGRDIFIHPYPETKRQAYRNLKAFSTEYIGGGRPPGFVPFESNTEINECLGWMKVTGLEFQEYAVASSDQLCQPDVTQDLYAIVYTWLPQGTLTKKALQDQLDFFWLTGFSLVPIADRNYRGSGILVDFSDPILPHDPTWCHLGFGYVVKDGPNNSFYSGNREPRAPKS
jgi:hypothetical protein